MTDKPNSETPLSEMTPERQAHEFYLHCYREWDGNLWGCPPRWFVEHLAAHIKQWRAQERQLVEAEIAARDLRIEEQKEALITIKNMDEMELLDNSWGLCNEVLAKPSPTPSAVARVVSEAEKLLDWVNNKGGVGEVRPLLKAVEAMREGWG